MRSRHRLIMLLIPAILALYIVMLPLNRVIEQEHPEIFPFFDWQLFAYVPDAEISKYGLILESIDGDQVDGVQYLIPNDKIRDWKALALVAETCQKAVSCDAEVMEIVYPIVLQLTATEVIEFRIVKARVDLDDIQANIRDIAAGRASRTDFFQIETEIGRWNTRTGRVG